MTLVSSHHLSTSVASWDASAISSIIHSFKSLNQVFAGLPLWRMHSIFPCIIFFNAVLSDDNATVRRYQYTLHVTAFFLAQCDMIHSRITLCDYGKNNGPKEPSLPCRHHVLHCSPSHRHRPPIFLCTNIFDVDKRS